MSRTTNIFNLHADILSDYKQFVSSFININDEQIKKVVEEEIHTGRFWPEPLVQFNPSFEILGPANEFCGTGRLLHPDIAHIFKGYHLFMHQVEAITLGIQSRDFVVTSGTGSGKSLDRKNFRPKDEESLSDEIARWIRDDLASSRGIIVNREVQPRRGQKTDIYVNAVKLDAGSGGADQLTVVIEVKGCWHDEVMTAMETQLLNRYMKENKFTHGLYIVGWYMCDKWSDKDSNKKKTPKMTFEDFKIHLEDQSKQLEEKAGGVSKITSVVINLAL